MDILGSLQPEVSAIFKIRTFLSIKNDEIPMNSQLVEETGEKLLRTVAAVEMKNPPRKVVTDLKCDFLSVFVVVAGLSLYLLCQSDTNTCLSLSSFTLISSFYSQDGIFGLHRKYRYSR